MDVCNADHRKRRIDVYPGTGFLVGFTYGGCSGGLAVFHKPGRERPVAVAGLDGAATHQYPAVELGDTPDNQTRILIVNEAAFRTHLSVAVVTFGNTGSRRGAANAAITVQGLQGSFWIGISLSLALKKVASADFQQIW